MRHAHPPLRSSASFVPLSVVRLLVVASFGSCPDPTPRRCRPPPEHPHQLRRSTPCRAPRTSSGCVHGFAGCSAVASQRVGRERVLFAGSPALALYGTGLIGAGRPGKPRHRTGASCRKSSTAHVSHRVEFRCACGRDAAGSRSRAESGANFGPLRPSFWRCRPVVGLGHRCYRGAPAEIRASSPSRLEHVRPAHRLLAVVGLRLSCPRPSWSSRPRVSDR